MPSVIGQGASALGSGLSALGGVWPQNIGGSQLQQWGPELSSWGQSLIPPSPADIGGIWQSSTDPSVTPYFGGAAGAPSPESVAGPAATALGPTGGVGANPAQLTEAAFSALPQATDPVTGGQLGPALGDPASSLTSGVLSALGLGGGGAAGGPPGAASNTPALLRLLAGGGVDVMKYLQQRSLLDPNALAKASQQLAQKNAAALRKSIYPGVTAQLQETGNINAPYLSAQAYTTAIAPTLANEQMAAMEAELAAQREAMGLYPGASSFDALGGFTEPDIFGGARA